jgi:hypothetical protein
VAAKSRKERLLYCISKVVLLKEWERKVADYKKFDEWDIWRIKGMEWDSKGAEYELMAEWTLKYHSMKRRPSMIVCLFRDMSSQLTTHRRQRSTGRRQTQLKPSYSNSERLMRNLVPHRKL